MISELHFMHNEICGVHLQSMQITSLNKHLSELMGPKCHDDIVAKQK